jgi:hypothetical protein
MASTGMNIDQSLDSGSSLASCGGHGADDGYCEVSQSLNKVRACFIDRCWGPDTVGVQFDGTPNGLCREGSTFSTSNGGAACCSEWTSTTANINEWMQLTCSLAHVHNAHSWVTISTFGPHGINSWETLAAAGWIMHNTDDFQVCGANGACSGWCPGTPDCVGYCDTKYACTGDSEWAGFWCPGGCSGSIELPLPENYNRARLELSMSYDNAACHGTVKVGGKEVWSNDGVAAKTEVRALVRSLSLPEA